MSRRRFQDSSTLQPWGRTWLAPAFFSLVLIATAPIHFTLFHTLAEFFAMGVAVTVFAVAWNTYALTLNSFLLFLGCGFLWIAGFDLVHTLAYRGMGVFSNADGGNLGAQFWIAGRFFEALVMLASPLFVRRHFDPRAILAAGGVLFALIYVLIFSGLFPDAYLEGQGLTPFKIVSEYVIVLMLIGAAALLRYHGGIDGDVHRLVTFAIAFTILAEMTFTLYVEIVSVSMVVGHLFKFWSYWFIYIALVRFTLRNPFQLLGRETGVYDAFPEPTALVDCKGVVRQINRALRQSAGHGLLGESCHERLHPRHLRQADCRVCQSIARGEPAQAIELFYPEQARWQEIALTPFFWSSRIVGMVHVSRDVTERHQAAETLARERDRARNYLEAAEVMLIALDNSGRVTSFNRKASVVTGWEEQEMIGRNWFALLPEPARDSAQATFRALLSGQPDRSEFNENEIITRAGERRLIAWHNAPLLDSQGRIVGTLSSGEDVTERRRDEERLRQAAAVYENSAEGVVISDPERHIVAVNPAFVRITGFTEGEMAGRPLSQTDAPLHDDGFYEALWHQLDDAGSWQGELRKVRKSGETFPVWEHISALRDASGRVTYYIAVFTDISTLKASEERLDQLAHHDPLTGKPNRLLFHARATHALQRAAREGTRIAVLFVDLDQFKKVNDAFGHAVGDRVLVEAAARLERCVRDEDTVARMGGDEFTVLLEPVHQAADAGKVAQKIVDALRAPMDLEGRELRVGGSVGVSIYPEHGRELETLLQHADVAMYRAKERGRGNYQFYTEELNANAQDRQTLESRLRQAFERQELVVHYQPQLEVASGRVVGVEALVRWHHPERGLLLPERFLALAEESGLIEPLDEWVLQTACRQGRQWRDEGLPPLRVAVNRSAAAVTNAGRVAELERILDETGFDPASLELEIDLGPLAAGEKGSMGSFHALKQRGVRLVVDHFGNGHSSLNELRGFPFDKLKIDKSLVENALYDEFAAAVVRAAIALGHNLQLTVAAEGVSSAAQLAFLRDPGHDGQSLSPHDQYQGFLCQYALPADELSRWLRNEEGRAVV